MKSNNQTTTPIQTAEIKLTEISFSPFNYRYGGKPVDEASLAEIAESIQSHGVIQAVTVRPRDTGKYELVVGERRFRGSKLAGKKTIPAVIRELTDEQVREIQVIENLQREDPHPMAEAMGIQQLLTMRTKKVTAEEIAAQIGKSVAYVYQRLKLNSLSEIFREIFFAGAINTSQALRIARLDEGSQNDFFVNHCQNWKEEDWHINSFNNRIRNYQLDLTEAPFDLKDTKLDKKAGACTRCPHNTAVTTSLFPEDSEDARCTNRPCYENKCRLFAMVRMATVLAENPDLPIAVADDTVLMQFFSGDDTVIKGRTVLIEDVDFDRYEELRKKPNREDFTDYEDDEENEQEYLEAMEYYQDELKELEEEVSNGQSIKAILIAEAEAGNIVYLNPIVQREDAGTEEGENRSVGQQSAIPLTDFKAKDYQEAVKSKTLSAEVITGERQRLITREERSKELDEIKLQESFYAALEAMEAVMSPEHPSGVNDRAVQVFILFDSLNYSWKQKLQKALFPETESRKDGEEMLMQFFFQATEAQVSVLVRMAMLNKAESKMPSCDAGKMLRLLVEGTPGMDAAELINVQRTIAKDREVKLAERLAILEVQEKKIS